MCLVSSLLNCKYICKQRWFLVFGGSLFMSEGVYNMGRSVGISKIVHDDFVLNLLKCVIFNGTLILCMGHMMYGSALVIQSTV